jgi:MFS family permease
VRRRLGNATRETFGSLRYRNFRLFFAGQLISQVGNWMTMTALVLLVFHLTHRGIAIGALAACQFAPVLLIGPWAGLVADRSDKRRLLMTVQTCAMAQSFALAALAGMGHAPVLAFYAVALAGGVFTAFDNPARRSFVTEMVPESNVQNAVSLNSAMMTGSRIVGPALAGLLITTVGFTWCFLGDAISYIAVLYGLWRMNTAELRPPHPAQRAKGMVRAGLRYVRDIPELRISLVVMAIIGTFAFNFNTVFPVFVKRSLHGTDATFTLVFSAMSIGSLLGALWTARRKEIELNHVVMSAFAFGGVFILLAGVPSLTLAFPVATLMGMASITFMTSSTTLLQLRAEPSMRGRVLALQAMVFLGSTPIGGPILGEVCDRFGPRVGLLVGAAACLGAASWGLAAGRKSRTRTMAIDETIVESGADLQPA